MAAASRRGWNDTGSGTVACDCALLRRRQQPSNRECVVWLARSGAPYADLMSDMVTVEAAYRAMHTFVKAYFERGGREGEELVLFLSYLSPDRWPPSADNPLGTGDPAAWSDWLAAIRTVVGD